MTTKELSAEDLIDLADKDSYEFSWMEVQKVIYELLKSRDELQEVRAEIEALKAKTLTDEEIMSVIEKVSFASGYLNGNLIRFARAILRKASEK